MPEINEIKKVLKQEQEDYQTGSSSSDHSAGVALGRYQLATELLNVL